MKTNLHLVFPGTCREAFAFYEKTFGGKVQMTMTYGEAPPNMSTPAGAKDLVMHTSMPLGSIILMGCDAWPGSEQKLGGFQVSVDTPDEAEVKRLFTQLSEDGSVEMALAPTFWTSLFGMCTDRFGVAWMVSVPGPMPD